MILNHPPVAALGIASATLTRATLFLGAGLRTPDHLATAAAIEGRNRAKVLGNSLRELDRFLNLLIDEVAAVMFPADKDRARLGRQRNTPNKLRAVRAAMTLPSPDHERLRAIGRARDCLFHCAGIVRRGDCRGDPALTPGWPAPGRIALGDRLIVTPGDLNQICRFYDQLAAELLAALDSHMGLY